MTNVCYPLTFSQNMLHQASIEFKTTQVLTIGICVAIQTDLDFPLLSRCIQDECKRQQCLRIHFTSPDSAGNISQYIVPELHLPIPYLDMSSLTALQAKEKMTLWSSQGFDEPHSPLCRFTMVSLQGGYHGIYLCIDHRIIDSNGLIFLFNDLFGLYCHYRYKTPIPAMPTGYEEMLSKDLEAEKDLQKRYKGTLFWEQLLSSAPPLRYAIKTNTSADGDMELCSLDQKASLSLSSYCKENSVSMTNLLLMAMRTCLSKTNEYDVSIGNYISRRSPSIYRSCGGCRIHSYPCRTIISPETTFLDGIRQIQTLQNHIYRHSDYDPLAVKNLMAHMYSIPPFAACESAALTCQPLLLSSKNPFLKYLPLSIDWFSSKADIQKLYLTVMEHPGSKGLNFYFKYQTAELNKQDIQLFYKNLTDILLSGISKPGILVEELTLT